MCGLEISVQGRASPAVAARVGGIKNNRLRSDRNHKSLRRGNPPLSDSSVCEKRRDINSELALWAHCASPLQAETPAGVRAGAHVRVRARFHIMWGQDLRASSIIRLLQISGWTLRSSEFQADSNVCWDSVLKNWTVKSDFKYKFKVKKTDLILLLWRGERACTARHQWRCLITESYTQWQEKNNNKNNSCSTVQGLQQAAAMKHGQH